MDWRKKLFKLPGRMTKESWIVLLCLGLIVMILAMPLADKSGNGKTGGGRAADAGAAKERTGGIQNSVNTIMSPLPETVSEEDFLWEERDSSYEAVLEARVRKC